MPRNLIIQDNQQKKTFMNHHPLLTKTILDLRKIMVRGIQETFSTLKNKVLTLRILAQSKPFQILGKN